MSNGQRNNLSHSRPLHPLSSLSPFPSPFPSLFPVPPSFASPFPVRLSRFLFQSPFSFTLSLPLHLSPPHSSSPLLLSPPLLPPFFVVGRVGREGGISRFSYSFIFLHGSSWFFMVLHGSSCSFMFLHGSSWFFMFLHVLSYSFRLFRSCISARL